MSHPLVGSETAPPPSVLPRCVYVSRHDVLEQALQKLSLELQEARTCVVGNGQILGSVCFDVPAHGQHAMFCNKKIFGDYKLVEEEALESAKLAALVYLQKEGIILVDDINLIGLTERDAELADCQRKLLAASNWAITFQERAESLEADLAITREENKKLADTVKVLYADKEAHIPGPIFPAPDKPILSPCDPTDDVPTSPLFGDRPKDQAGSRTRRALGASNVKRTLFKASSSAGS